LLLQPDWQCMRGGAANSWRWRPCTQERSVHGCGSTFHGANKCYCGYRIGTVVAALNSQLSGQGVDMAVQLSSLPFFCLCPMVSDTGVATVRVLLCFDRSHAAGSNEWCRAGFGPISPVRGPTYLSRCLMIRIQNPATRVILHSFPDTARIIRQ
jgi:hypothetical protein